MTPEPTSANGVSKGDVSPDASALGEVRPFQAGGWVIAAWLVAGVAYLVVARVTSAPVLLGQLLLTAAPAAAALACAAAALSSPPSLRATWLFFATAAAAVTLRQLIQLPTILATGTVGASPLPLAFALLLGAHLALAAGAALAVPPLRSRAVAGGLLLDLSLVLIAGALFAVKLAGDAVPGVEGLALLRTLATHLVVAMSMVLLGLLLIWRDPALQPAPVAALVTTGVVFALGNGIVTLTGPSTAPWMYVLWLTGWAALVFAGVSARGLGSPWSPPRPGRATQALGGVLIPAGALYIGALGVNYALHPYIRQDIGLALWFLGAPFALRVGQGLRAEAHRMEQGRELVNTRALVELNRALAGAVELDPTLRLVTHWATQLTGARASALLLLSPDEATLRVAAVTGLPGAAVGIELPVNGSVAGAATRVRRMRTVDDWRRAAGAHHQELALFGRGIGAVAPLLFRDRVLGALVVAGRPRPFFSSRLAMLGSLADSAAVAIENAQLFEEVKALSLIDPLTGLANRRALERDLARDFAAARRGRPLTAVLFDIDGFKRFNDTLGHMAGDEALRALGAVLQKESRAMNLAARYGGDEFLALMSDADVLGATTYAQRTRERFCAAVEHFGQQLDLTYGIAAYDPSMESPAELIAAVDRALYRAKARSATSSVNSDTLSSSST